MASLLVAGGEPGNRVALPNASLMIHQVRFNPVLS